MQTVNQNQMDHALAHQGSRVVGPPDWAGGPGESTDARGGGRGELSGSGGTGCRMGACIWVSVGAHCRGARGAYGCLRVHTGAFVDVSGSPWPPAGPPGLSRGPPSRGAAGQACVASS